MRLWKPALFSTPMVQATLAARKTQTRRCRGLEVVNEEPAAWSLHAANDINGQFLFTHEDGERLLIAETPWPVGTRLYVKEKWGCPDADHPRCKDGRKPRAGDRFVYGADPADAYQWRGGGGCGDFAWRSSRFMFRFVARIGLEVTAVRCQQVQDITEADAIAEGIDPREVAARGWTDARTGFRILWDSLNAKRGYGWGANPWVFAYGFKLLSTDYAETQRLMTEDAK